VAGAGSRGKDNCEGSNNEATRALRAKINEWYPAE
jgi:hypothetical protein